ncbi:MULTISPECIES: serine hydrolase [Pseudomonas]|uniref:serine hydrolase domain-containing protein n=1 Tax=Pseudomonadaceae TaxID=135621 RepID=UPI0010F77FCA|nr:MULTISPECIES: serine hydrolase domain-containing protein [Pseudomonas]MDE3738824.1 serine hydrolase [Pseudomonas resinovorans]
MQANDAGMSPERLQRLSSVLQGYVERSEVAGLVAMVYRKDILTHCDVLGSQDIETRTPMRRNSLFRIASMTKPVTSAAAMMLIEEGRLLLDDPISRWIPELGNRQVLRNPDGPLDDVYPAPRDITVRDLLLHRSGLAYPVTASPSLAEPLSRFNAEVLPTGNPDGWLRALGELPLLFEPGTRWHYGLSTDVLGLLIGRVAGCSFQQFLESRIFEPLDMNDTFFSVPVNELKRLTVGYVVGDQPNQLIVHDHPERRIWNPTGFPSGGAGLISTADDYAKFARMLLHSGRSDAGRILSRKSIELMTTNFLTPEERATPFMGIPGFWAAQGFGLGLSVIDNTVHQATLGSIGQFGWPGAYGTTWLADPKEEMVAVLMVQLYWATHCQIGQHFQSLVYQAIDD